MSRIYQQNWQNFTGPQVAVLFSLHFNNVSFAPDSEIMNELRSLQVAAIEIIEDRTLSTVYRIYETATVYQCSKAGCKVFEDLKAYRQTQPEGELIALYKQKEPVHRFKKLATGIIIERLKPPQFAALFTTGSPTKVVWNDEETTPEIKKKLLKNATAFYLYKVKK